MSGVLVGGGIVVVDTLAEFPGKGFSARPGGVLIKENATIYVPVATEPESGGLKNQDQWYAPLALGEGTPVDGDDVTVTVAGLTATTLNAALLELLGMIGA